MSASPAVRDRRRRTRVLVVVAILVLVVAAAGILWLGGDAPAAVDGDRATAALEDASGETADDGTEADEVEADGAEAGDAATDEETADGAATADGAWVVDTAVEDYDLTASTGTFIGYRIDEELAEVGATEAVGRTPTVTGGLTVAGTTVSDVEVTGDLADLTSDRTQRDGRVREALRASEHPTVSFTAEGFELPAELADGEDVDVDVPGTLTAAGGETDVVAVVSAARRGDTVVVTGSLEVALSDLGIEAPSAARVLSVADTATVEWQLYLTRG